MVEVHPKPLVIIQQEEEVVLVLLEGMHLIVQLLVMEVLVQLLQ
jgi:hypothetical protein